jgi:hypothetical protein
MLLHVLLRVLDSCHRALGNYHNRTYAAKTHHGVVANMSWLTRTIVCLARLLACPFLPCTTSGPSQKHTACPPLTSIHMQSTTLCSCLPACLPARLTTHRCIPAYPAKHHHPSAAEDAPPALKMFSDQLSHAANPNVILPACLPAYPSLYPHLPCRKYCSG